MKPSPIGSKLLSGYAILFAGLAPAGLALVGLVNGVGWTMLGNVILGALICYFGARVFAGHYAAVRLFSLLVIMHYLGIAATNYWGMDEFPAVSRAAQMAVPRMIRGVIFAMVYAWYYFIRRKTAEGFGPPPNRATE